MRSLEAVENKSLCIDNNGNLQVIFMDETPEHITVLKSGWLDLFHVITENGEYMTADHQLLDSDQFKKKYGFSTSLADVL